MKTSELKRIVEENGYEFKMNRNGIDVFINAPLGIYFYTQDGDSIGLGDRYRIKHHKAITITKALLDYIQTPISEREDEKKYKIELNEICEGVLSKEEMRTMVYSMSSRIQSTLHQKLIFKEVFTQQEIDNFPKEIKGAIECGFLRKVEVE